MKTPLLIVALTAATALQAQEFGRHFGFRGIVPKQEKSIPLNEVVVESSSMGGTSFNLASSKVTVIQHKEIQDLPVQNLNELLEYVAAVDVRQRGPLDVQADVSVRGGTFDQTLILVNGVRMNNPQTGHHNMNLPVSLHMIERIEIVHNGAAAAQGIGAMTGVINIILKEAPKRLNFGFSMATGENALIGNSFYAGKRMGPWGVQLSQEHGQSAGYLPNTDFVNDKLFLTASRKFNGKFEDGTLQLFLGENTKSFGASNYYTPAYPDQFESVRTRLYGMNFTSRLDELYKLTWNMSAVQGFDRFELYRESAGLGGYDASPIAYEQLSSGRYYRAFDGDTAQSWYTGPNFHRTTVFNNYLRLSRTVDLHRTSLAFVQRMDFVRSNVLGKPAEPVLVPRWEPFTMDKTDDRFNMAVLLEHRFSTERSQITAGLMTNAHRGIDSSWSPFLAPSLSSAYRLTQVATLYANVNRSMRYPTYTDLYYNRGGAQGSTDLNPESAWSFEAGYKWTSQNFHASSALFHRRSRDLIDWVTYNGDPTAYASNVTAFALTGMDAQLTYLASKRKAALRSATASLVLMQGNQRKRNFTSLYALDYLRAKFNARATQKLGWGFFATYSLTVQDRVGSFQLLSGEEVNYDPFALVDLKVYYAPARGLFKRQYPFQAYIQVNNALDAFYYDRGSVALPGRWISSGLQFKFR